MTQERIVPRVWVSVRDFAEFRAGGPRSPTGRQSANATSTEAKRSGSQICSTTLLFPLRSSCSRCCHWESLSRA